MVFKFRQIICVYYDYLLNSKKEWYVVGESVTTSSLCYTNLYGIKIYTNYMTARRHVYPVMSAPQSVRSGNGHIFNFLILVFRL